MSDPFRFRPQKAIEVVLYLAGRLNAAGRRRPTLHNVSKLLYFADKRHLEHYLRPICGDHYVAMRYGPVPGNVYGLMKAVREESPGGPSGALRKAKEAFEVSSRHIVKPLREADEMELSESDEECLDWALERYGRMSFDELTEASHDASWRKNHPNGRISVEDMAVDFERREPFLEYLRDPNPGVAGVDH